VKSISYVGATPVFADLDPKTWCISADSLEECITSRAKAVIPVDLYGNLPSGMNMDVERVNYVRVALKEIIDNSVLRLRLSTANKLLETINYEFRLPSC
jgi:hypothetical protein